MRIKKDRRAIATQHRLESAFAEKIAAVIGADALLRTAPFAIYPNNRLHTSVSPVMRRPPAADA